MGAVCAVKSVYTIILYITQSDLSRLFMYFVLKILNENEKNSQFATKCEKTYIYTFDLREIYILLLSEVCVIVKEKTEAEISLRFMY